MAKPLVAQATIYETALQILDEQGVDGLSARNLASALQCSTRTLYQQVGKREQLIEQLLDYYFSNIQLDFTRECSWQASATSWANAIRLTLLVHPNLSRLMTVENRTPIVDFVNELLKILSQAGFNEEFALRSCRVLINIVISLSLAEINTPPSYRSRRKSRKAGVQFDDLVIASPKPGLQPTGIRETPEVFSNAVRWTIDGIEKERMGLDGEGVVHRC